MTRLDIDTVVESNELDEVSGLVELLNEEGWKVGGDIDFDTRPGSIYVGLTLKKGFQDDE